METMGQKLRAAREKKRIPISRAAALTRMKVQHIELMEMDDFSKMPAPTYAKGFIRIYADFLGLDSAPLVQEYIDRHLNAPEEEAPRARKSRPEPAAGSDAGPGRNISARELAATILPRVLTALAAMVPHLPRLAAALVAVLLLVGIVRCTARLGDASSGEEPGSGQLHPQAIMKEPPVRYLPLPGGQEENP